MDTQNQQQIAGMIASMGIFFALFGLIVAAFFIFLFWRIFTKAGLSGPLALIAIIPGIGPIIVLCILAFSQWRVTPVPPGYDTSSLPYPPAYPPQAYPPQKSSADYLPPSPPSQL